jgi:hypothetical protein
MGIYTTHLLHEHIFQILSSLLLLVAEIVNKVDYYIDYPRGNEFEITPKEVCCAKKVSFVE